MSVAVVATSEPPASASGIPRPGTEDYARWASVREEIIQMNHEITVLHAKTAASKKSVRNLNTFTCLAGYHQESSRIMLSINLVLTFIVAVGSVLTRTEEAAMISLFAYLPVIALAILQMRVSIAIKSRAHIAMLQYYSIASFMFAGIALMLRVYALIVDRHHGHHVLDIVVLVCQACEMIISIVILVGADQEGFALGQISAIVARLHHAELVQSDAHQRHIDSTSKRSVWAHTKSLIWFVTAAPLLRIWRWRSSANTRPKLD
jgi:hypothetical protein